MGMKVLVADDHPDAAYMLGMVIGSMGHDVKICQEGAEALAVAREWKPDVAVLDLAMPAINGYELCRRIKSDPGLKGTFLIAHTGYKDPAHVGLGWEAGFDAYVPKPAEPSEWEQLLKQAKEEREGR